MNDRTQNLEHSLERVESVVREVEELADPAARARVQDIVQGLLDYYGAGISQMLKIVASDGGPNVMERLVSDKLVASLLLLHDLHPDDMPTRVERALDDVRPFLKSHGGDVELIEVTNDGAIRLRMNGSCHGCPSSAVTMKTKIEQAIYEAAPDADRVELDESAPSGAATQQGFVPLTALTGVNGTT